MRLRTGQYVLLLVSMALPGPAAAACLLNDYSTLTEYQRSEVVVTGHVTAERAVVESGLHLDGIVYSVEVDEVYRGAPGRSLEVFSENSSGRFPMQRGEQYVLFISRDVDRAVVDNCGNSGPVSQNAAVLRAVRSLVTPKGDGQKPNKPLERPGTNADMDIPDASAGRSAPIR